MLRCVRSFLLPVLAAVLAVPAASAPVRDVGRISREWTDPGRADRPVPVEIFHPSSAAGGWAGGPDGGVAAFPVLVFGHATLTPWTEYETLVRDLAAAGLVVVLPRTEMGFPPDHGAFAADMAFAAERLRELGSVPGSFFEGRIGAGAAFAGHSLGGGAAILAAAATGAAAVVAFAPQDAKPSASAAAPGVDAAVLIIVGTEDCVTPAESHAGPIHDSLDCEPRAYVRIAEAGHCGFAAGAAPCADAEASCPWSMPAADQREIAALLAKPWLTGALGPDPGALQFFSARLDSIPGLEWETTAVPVPAAPDSWGGVKGMFR